MFGFAHFYYTDAVSFLDMLPAINADLIEEARLLVKNSLFFGLLEGSLTGIPYKIFAVHSGNSGVHILLFLLASIPARSLRFILVIGASAFISHVLLKHLSLKRKKQLHIGLWLLFYLGYFNHMGG